MSNAEFAGTGVLTRFILKRDKFFIPLWMLGMAILCIGIAPAIGEMFSTDTDRAMMAETMKNPAMIAMCGPCYDFENYTNGAMYAQMMLMWCAMLWAIMNIFLVVRHTRKDEEEGRLEMIKSLPTGRQAVIFSTMNVTIVINILMSLIIGFGIGVMGIDDMGLESSLLFGFANGMAGLVFAAITLVFAQLSSNTRGAIGYPLALVGVFYIIRAMGDISADSLTYLSPFGIASKTEVYVNDKWWPIIALVIIAALLFVLAFKLNSVRDMEQGLIAAKKGKSHASPLLGSTFTLSMRLLRSTIIAWAVAIFLLGAAYGSIFGDIEAFIDSSEIIKLVFATDPNANMTMQFVDTLMVIMSIIGTVAVIMTVYKLRGEEKRGRLDEVLARNVSRVWMLSSYVIIAVVLTVVLQCLTVLGLWSASYYVMDEPLALTEVFKSGLIYIPAMLVFVGIATTLTGIFPRGTMLAWLLLGYAFFNDYLGKLLELPEWTNNITPFGLTPRFPTEEFEPVPIIGMCVVAVALIVIGLVGFRNRDIRQN